MPPFNATVTLPTNEILTPVSVGIQFTQVGEAVGTALTLSLSAKLALIEVLSGLHFTGTTTIPPIECEGVEGIALGLVMSAAFSGPENPYSLSITPPPPTGM